MTCGMRKTAKDGWKDPKAKVREHKQESLESRQARNSSVLRVLAETQAQGWANLGVDISNSDMSELITRSHRYTKLFFFLLFLMSEISGLS